MSWQTLMQRLALACGVLATGVVAQAQPPTESIRPQPSLTQGPLMYGPLPNYGVVPSYVGADLRDTADTVSVPPIFYTSINYPGVYGSHTTSIVARSTRTWPRMRDYPPASGIALEGQRRYVDPGVSRATMRVHVPTVEAALYLNGERARGTGTTRDIESAVLLAARDYTFDLRVEWRDRDGRDFVSQRRVTLRAGDNSDIDLTPPAVEQPEERQSPTLRTMPLPRTPRQ
jgi:uncharacterized protein (TIGR03000 family)